MAPGDLFSSRYVLFQFKIFKITIDMGIYPHVIRKIIYMGLNLKFYFPLE